MMNEVNFRFKQDRKALKLNQEEYGEKLGITGSGVSNLESGKRNLTEQMKIAVAHAFGVNRNWLDTGEGEMFSVSDELGQELGRIFANADEKMKSTLLAFAKLGPEEWAVLEKLIKTLKEN